MLYVVEVEIIFKIQFILMISDVHLVFAFYSGWAVKLDWLLSLFRHNYFHVLLPLVVRKC